jgi:hypothetical protein
LAPRPNASKDRSKTVSVHWEVEIRSRFNGTWISPFMPMQEEAEARALMAQLCHSKRLVKVDSIRKVEIEELHEEKRPH